jgi:hypothetical protein
MELEMNERIKELMKQADYPAPEMALRAQKLAKLVVKDCMEIVQNLSPGYKDYRDQIEDAFRRDAVQEIKYKFEIEN